MKELIVEKLIEYDTIIIHGHLRPDGDCYGSQFGLKYTIENTYPNKKVYVVGEETEFYTHIGKKDQIDDSVYDEALVIVVDTGTTSRISDQRYNKGKYLIKIDHHIPVDNYGDIQWVDTTYPACSLMITDLFDDYQDKFKMTREAAIALYTGIVTDTSGFKYRGVNEFTLLKSSTLLKFDIDMYSDIYKYIKKRPLNKVKFEGYVCQNFESTPNGFAYIKLPLSVQNEFEVDNEVAASSVAMLSDIEGIKAWAVFIEYGNDSIRGRLRSNDIPISDIANEFGGGGHQFACGTNHDNWESIDKLIKRFDEYLKEM